ncbi:MAG TPA: molybdopterin oxidoreductase family protein, partial [Myxococcota bacterium]|nr:molybdopterin oxidoreductase family protein [Myxococcota bacterium]
MTVHHRTCSLCDALCRLRIDVEDGRVTRIAGEPDDPFSRGHVCPKAVALRDLHEDPDRLRAPLRRTPTGWQEIGW